MEEMGMTADLKEIFHFIYKEELDNHLTEHELDHVFIGFSDVKPAINTNEVVEWKYISYNDLTTNIASNPSEYTVWFKKIIKRVNEHIKNR